MPYRVIEHLNKRSEERIAPFLNVSQITAGVIALMVAMFLNGVVGGGIIATIVIYGCCIGLAIFLATDFNGMLYITHLLWLVRAHLSQWLAPRGITPDDLPGSAVQLSIIIRERGEGALVRVVSSLRSPERSHQPPREKIHADL